MKARGVVESFSAKSGFGFIRLVGGKDVYVDRSAFQVLGASVLRIGLEVECDVEPGPMGLRALNVRYCAACELPAAQPPRQPVGVPGRSSPVPVREAPPEGESHANRSSRTSA